MKKLKSLMSKIFACPITLQQSSEERGWKISSKPRKSIKKAAVPVKPVEEAFEASNDDRIRF